MSSVDRRWRDCKPVQGLSSILCWTQGVALGPGRGLWEASILFDFGIYTVISLTVLFYYYFEKIVFLDD